MVLGERSALRHAQGGAGRQGSARHGGTRHRMTRGSGVSTLIRGRPLASPTSLINSDVLLPSSPENPLSCVLPGFCMLLTAREHPPARASPFLSPSPSPSPYPLYLTHRPVPPALCPLPGTLPRFLSSLPSARRRTLSLARIATAWPSDSSSASMPETLPARLCRSLPPDRPSLALPVPAACARPLTSHPL
eukprot:5634538-Pleurochrysis_carterae.AAC.2